MGVYATERGRRFPFDPVIELLAGRGEPDKYTGELTDRAMSVMLGVHHKSVTRWRQKGLSVRTADRIACALGRHPITIWPDFWADMEDVA